jgi:hypothetical protein
MNLQHSHLFIPMPEKKYTPCRIVQPCNTLVHNVQPPTTQIQNALLGSYQTYWKSTPICNGVPYTVLSILEHSEITVNVFMVSMACDLDCQIVLINQPIVWSLAKLTQLNGYQYQNFEDLKGWLLACKWNSKNYVASTPLWNYAFMFLQYLNCCRHWLFELYLTIHLRPGLEPLELIIS